MCVRKGLGHSRSLTAGMEVQRRGGGRAEADAKRGRSRCSWRMTGGFGGVVQPARGELLPRATPGDAPKNLSGRHPYSTSMRRLARPGAVDSQSCPLPTQSGHLRLVKGKPSCICNGEPEMCARNSETDLRVHRSSPPMPMPQPKLAAADFFLLLSSGTLSACYSLAAGLVLRRGAASAASGACRR